MMVQEQEQLPISLVIVPVEASVLSKQQSLQAVLQAESFNYLTLTIAMGIWALVRSYKMEIKKIEIQNIDGTTVTHVIIDRGNGEFTSMLKSTWDELEAQREQSGTL